MELGSNTMDQTSPRHTSSTLVSTDLHSFASTNDHPTPSTAMTSPSLASPGKLNNGKLGSILSVFEESAAQTSLMKRGKEDVTRGPSVRQRASQFEHFGQQAEASSSRNPMGTPIGRTRSTSPLRINRPLPAPRTPAAQRRIPVPATAPPRTQRHEQPSSPKGRRSPTKLNRGSTKKMVQQWEHGPARSTPQARLASGNFSRQYLDEKPLPSPAAQPISNYSTPGRAYPISPSARQPYTASPLHLQTPRRASQSLSTSPSSWSLSASGEKRKKGRSPLKEMLNVFGGGILRKAKGKSKDKFQNDYYESSVGLDRMGSNGLPGGIVFRDRMGDQEMTPAVNSNYIRSTSIIYLIPTPCSSVSQWGSWLTSWGSLSPSKLQITYCPIFQDPQAGLSSPKRVFSSSSFKGPDSFVWSAIPSPESVVPDVELTMKDCVEVRSLRREEVKGRGVPAVPNGAETEVLEMVWSDGSKRYIGVEGVAGRLGWVSAIWDVLLACKSDGMPALPPPSPFGSPRTTSVYPANAIQEPIETYVDALVAPGRSGSPRPRVSSGSTLKMSRGDSTAPPVQKIGDRWVAASALGTSQPGSLRRDERTPGALRESVKKMFEAEPDVNESMDPAEKPIATEVNNRILAWQPSTERDLSIFSRNHSRRSELPYRLSTFLTSEQQVELDSGAETALSFDPNDLNPSRSASQVRRSPLLGRDPSPPGFQIVDEDPAERTTILPDPTHISHATFPKPTIGGIPTGPNTWSRRVGALEVIPSVTNSSVETDEQTIKTPTNESAGTAMTSLENGVMDKLENHSVEHGTLSRQVDGVHVDLRQVILSLSTLIADTKASSMEDRVPKALDQRLSTLGMDVKAIENALNLSQLTTNRLPMADKPAEADPQMAEVHQKLDAIAKLCEDVLGRSSLSADSAVVKKEEGRPTDGGALVVGVDADEEKSAGHEVAQIMADLTGASTKPSPRLGGLTALNNPSQAGSPPPASTAGTAPMTDDTRKQVGEVLTLVTELKEARTLQTQQTTDIARYLNELNSWLEKFVLNSTTEIASMSKRLTTLVGSEPNEATGEKQFGMPDLVADMHSMISEQKRRAESEGTATQRLDALLQMMGQERERAHGQAGMVEQVIGALDRQRGENENLLRALATDLTAEIRGERIRFVEAMQQATTMNISVHVEEFKKLLSAEVGKAMKELGQLREERKALEHQISDLFALKAKHGGRDSRKASAAVPPPHMQPQSPALGVTLNSPAYGMRGLPPPPGR